jgi:hypothetical protein
MNHFEKILAAYETIHRSPLNRTTHAVVMEHLR